MKHTDHTLCWHCHHAVPTKDKITGEYLTGCAWSIDHRPVEGWRTCQHRMYEAQNFNSHAHVERDHQIGRAHV